MLPGMCAPPLVRSVTPDSTIYTASGSFAWPDADFVDIELYAGGAGGQYFTAGNAWVAGDGGDSTFNTSTLVCKGGKAGGTTPTGSGGTLHAGEAGTNSYGGAAGDPGTGSGVNGARQTSLNASGNNYGGAGSPSTSGTAAVGGNGGECRTITLAGTAFAIGATVSFTIGAGGLFGNAGTSHGNNPGAPGALRVAWR